MRPQIPTQVKNTTILFFLCVCMGHRCSINCKCDLINDHFNQLWSC